MTHKHKKASHFKKSKSREWQQTHAKDISARSMKPKLDIVLKCDSSGSVEAVSAAVSRILLPEVDINIIYSGVGDVHKSDILVAVTGSRLIVGFQVGVLHGVDMALREFGVEVRLHDVIYKLTADIRSIAESMIPHVPAENIIGSARVIALFKSSRKGIILGCEVLNGYLALGHRFHIISAMGPVYTGTIESMKIEKDAVQKAVQGQQAGIKIRDFNKAKIGDLMETFRVLPLTGRQPWKPSSAIIRKLQ